MPIQFKHLHYLQRSRTKKGKPGKNNWRTLDFLWVTRRVTGVGFLITGKGLGRGSSSIGRPVLYGTVSLK